MQNSTEPCRDQYEQQLIHNDEVQRIPEVLHKSVCSDLFVLKHLSLLVRQWTNKPFWFQEMIDKGRPDRKDRSEKGRPRLAGNQIAFCRIASIN